MRKILVIGAGASGLITAKRLLDEGFEVKILEKTETIGGTWVYREEVGEEIHSSMYKNLTTNLPKNTMSFIGYPFDSSLPTYMGHSKVLEYLEQFTIEVGLKGYIQFHCKVTEILPKNPEIPLTGEWIAKWENTIEGTLHEEEFDGVAICNGHYSVPHYPHIENIENFKGRILHSHSYRENSSFEDKNVVIVGAGISGGDISRELMEVANKVYICMRNIPQMEYSSKLSGIKYKANLKRIDENGRLVLENEETLQQIDCILFCTGYEYSFRFLNTQQELVKLKYKRVCDLFLHIFPFNHLHPQVKQYQEQRNKEKSILRNNNISTSENNAISATETHVETIFPTIAFIGLPWRVTPFPLFDYQSQYVGKVWSKQISLPSISDILLDIQRCKDFLKKKNFPPHYLHMLSSLEWSYISQLRRFINNEPTPENENNNNNNGGDIKNNNSGSNLPDCCIM